MAFIPAEERSSVAHISPSSIQDQVQTAQNIVISPMGQSEVPVPGQGFISNAVMTQEGSDLILESPDGITLVIEGYFSGETPPDLISSDGKVLTPALVKSFIQASTDYAEEPIAMNDVTPVGSVQEVSGNATVTHENGTKEALTKGMAIYEGDVIETDAKGAVNIEFVDESSFAVSNNAKMAVDEFSYDSKSHGGENNFSMLRGLFVYTSGLVGREDPDDVKINTPVGSIGIRGTIITGVIPEEGSSQPAQISVVEGAIVVHTNNGTDHTLSQKFETLQIDTKGDVTNIGVLTDVSMSQTFNVLRSVAPTLFSAMEESQQETAPTPTGEDTQGTVPDAPAEAVPADQNDAAPQEEPAPAPLPDVIQLNLLPGILGTDPLEHQLAQLQSNDPLRNLPSSGFETISAAVIVPVVVAPVAGEPLTPPADVPYNPEPATPAQPQPLSAAPVALLGSYTAYEQALVKSEVHQFDVSRFFSDDVDANMTYTITVTSGASTLASQTATMAGIVTLTMNVLSEGSVTPVELQITATDSDGQTSGAVTFYLTAYGTNIAGTSGDDVTPLSNTNKIANYYGGDDTIDIFGSYNHVFGSTGADTLTIQSGTTGNNVYGDGGADYLSILGGNNQLISGGTDDDSLSVTMTSSLHTFKAFGGTGDDEINITNGDAAVSLTRVGTVIDGGTGFDTITFNPGFPIDLRNVIAGNLIDIEKIRLLPTGSDTIQLDLQNIFDMNSDTRSLFLDVDSDDSIIIADTGFMGNLVATGGTEVDGTGTTYNTYSNGTVTLYISQDANMSNVSGAIT